MKPWDEQFLQLPEAEQQRIISTLEEVSVHIDAYLAPINFLDSTARMVFGEQMKVQAFKQICEGSTPNVILLFDAASNFFARLCSATDEDLTNLTLSPDALEKFNAANPESSSEQVNPPPVGPRVPNDFVSFVEKKDGSNPPVVDCGTF
jgi:hypothetical protein